MEIHYSSDCFKLAPSEVECLQAIALALTQSYPLEGEVQLIITDDIFIKELNANYRGKDIPTDVLSFPLEKVDTPDLVPLSSLVGEIYISLPRAQDQANLLNAPFLTEMARLFTHGFLHLAGWTHDTNIDLAAMEKETERFLAIAGLLPN